MFSVSRQVLTHILDGFTFGSMFKKDQTRLFPNAICEKCKCSFLSLYDSCYRVISMHDVQQSLWKNVGFTLVLLHILTFDVHSMYYEIEQRFAKGLEGVTLLLWILHTGVLLFFSFLRCFTLRLQYTVPLGDWLEKKNLTAIFSCFQY